MREGLGWDGMVLLGETDCETLQTDGSSYAGVDPALACGQVCGAFSLKCDHVPIGPIVQQEADALCEPTC